jgi:hypothetical protein
MEVHHHSHTARKKWTHYFWEFLMLFLAVFCGFLAEYQLEHVIENKREKQFMRSIIEDLKSDTATIRKILTDVEERSNNIDSMLLLLTGNDISDEAVVKAYSFTYPALNNLPLVFNDRTITQLKNAGNMRLIRNQKVNDGIIQYWNHIEVITKAMDRHMAYRTKGRDMETIIFNVAEIFLNNNRRVHDPTEPVHLVSHDKILIRQYSNVIAYCGVMLNSLQNQITEQNKLALELIELIKKEYHIK